MELSRQAAIRRMVEEDMGVGIVHYKQFSDAVTGPVWLDGGLRRADQLGVGRRPRLTGGYDSPIVQTFIKLARSHFGVRLSGLHCEKTKPSPAKRLRENNLLMPSGSGADFGQKV